MPSRYNVFIIQITARPRASIARRPKWLLSARHCRLIQCVVRPFDKGLARTATTRGLWYSGYPLLLLAGFKWQLISDTQRVYHLSGSATRRNVYRLDRDERGKIDETKVSLKLLSTEDESANDYAPPAQSIRCEQLPCMCDTRCRLAYKMRPLFAARISGPGNCDSTVNRLVGKDMLGGKS